MPVKIGAVCGWRHEPITYERAAAYMWSTHVWLFQLMCIKETREREVCGASPSS